MLGFLARVGQYEGSYVEVSGNRVPWGTTIVTGSSAPARPGVAPVTGSLLGHEFALVVDDAALAAYLAEVYRDSVGPVTDPEIFEVRTLENRRVTLTAGGEVVESGIARSRALALLVWLLNRRSVTSGIRGGSSVAVHAAAVELDGAGILVAGPSGGGKSTTAIGLGRLGFRYLTDDVLLVRPDGVIEGSRKPIGIRDPSLPILGVDRSTLPIPPDGWVGLDSAPVAASMLGVAIAERAVAEVILFPTAQGRSGVLREIRRSEALQRLAEFVFDREILRTDGLEILAQSVRRSATFEWVHGAHSALADALREILDGK